MSEPATDYSKAVQPAVVCPHERRHVAARHGHYTLYRCEQCEVVFSDNGGKKYNPVELYEDFYKNEIGGRFNFGIEYVIKLLRLFRAFKIFKLNPRAKSILDIGSGRGFMLYFLKKFFGYTRTVGTQISRPALEFSRQKLGLEIYDKDLLELPLEPSQFEVVTIWHVLEHVEKPEEYIQKIHRILKPGGHLLVEVPNYDSWTRKATGSGWLGLDLQYHLYFFSPKSLGKILEKNGFTINRIHTFSLEYSTFISTQSWVSRITNSDQVFFQWLQNKNKSKAIALHAALFALLMPICFLVNCLLYFSKRGEVLLIVATRNDPS